MTYQDQTAASQLNNTGPLVVLLVTDDVFVVGILLVVALGVALGVAVGVVLLFGVMSYMRR